MPRRALRLVYEWLDQHQEELLANWERLGKSLDPFTVDWSNEIGFAPEYLYEIGTAA